MNLPIPYNFQDLYQEKNPASKILARQIIDTKLAFSQKAKDTMIAFITKYWENQEPSVHREVWMNVATELTFNWTTPNKR